MTTIITIICLSLMLLSSVLCIVQQTLKSSLHYTVPRTKKKEIFYHLQLPLLLLHLNSFERQFCNCLNFLLIQRTTTKSTIKTQTNNLTTNQSNFVMLFSFVGVDCSILWCSALKFNIWYTYIILIKPKNNN